MQYAVFFCVFSFMYLQGGLSLAASVRKNESGAWRPTGQWR